MSADDPGIRAVRDKPQSRRMIVMGFETCGERHGVLEQTVNDIVKDVEALELWKIKHEQDHTDDLKQRNKNWLYWVGTSVLALGSIIYNIFKG